jgi:tellurite methyltransferase
MSMEDAERWNQRYQTDWRNSFELPRKLLSDNVDLIPDEGLALDIAMGLGGNANFLLLRGLRVIGVDISRMAVSKAKSKFPALMGVVADLNHFWIPTNTFCVIIDFLYLQRDLWAPMLEGLIKGGVVLVECLLEDMLSIHPEINPQLLLKPGELRQAFDLCNYGGKMEILHYGEGWRETTTSHPRSSASIIVRRIT